jgi:hypothetical protein
MSKKLKPAIDDDLHPHYDLRSLLRKGVLGKYAERYRAGTNLVLLEPDIAKAFSSDKDVNEALRLVLQMSKIRIGKKRRLEKQEA